MTAMGPLVSVVTPVYNGEAYLAECIESVLAQTYTNWDYTLVNNCSTDRTLEIAGRYAATDSRIRIRTNRTLLPALANHNAAFREISRASKYAKAVFADDWIFPECLERMVALAEASPTVGIVGAYGLRGGTVMWTGLPYPSTVVSGRDICRHRFLRGAYLHGTPTSHLIRSDLVFGRQPFYDESVLHADTDACMALMRVSDFGFVHQVLTYFRDWPESRTAESELLNTLIAGELRDLAKYGRDFLTEPEFQHCLETHLWRYYRFLAASAITGREQKFWRYHEERLAELGMELSKWRLARSVAATLVDLVLNPKRTMEEIGQGKSIISKRLGKRRSIRERAPRQRSVLLRDGSLSG